MREFPSVAKSVLTNQYSRIVDTYYGFAELAADNAEGVDYRCNQRLPANASLAHLAIHGGAIEPPTTQLAAHCAIETGCAFYSFEGISSRDNSALHIKSVRFDEPRALALVARVQKTVAWHGTIESGTRTFVGGRDMETVETVVEELRCAGFVAVSAVPAHLAGTSPHNIVNSNCQGQGVQLEITEQQRREFFDRGSLQPGWIADAANRTAVFYAYTAAVNRALCRL